MKAVRLALVLMVGLLILCSANAIRADVVIYPGDNNIFNVKAAPYNAKGDGVTDDTAAIQSAMNDIIALKRPTSPGGRPSDVHHTLYFPAGTYRVTAPLTFGRETSTGAGGQTAGLQRKIHIKGESRSGTVIRLADATPLFTDSAVPRIVFSFIDRGSNDAFGNTIEDMTIDVGSGNPGSIALSYHNNNYGYVRRITLQSADGQGAVGLTIPQTNAGIGLVKDIEVRGFDYGIVNSGDFKITYALENITLSNQNIGGILSRDKALSVRRLMSTNSVPALIQDSASADGQDDNGQVIIIESLLQGGAPDQPAIDNADGWVLARDITTSGYGVTVRDHGQNITLAADDEYVTGGVSQLFTSSPAKTLNLSIQETPDVSQDPQSDWAIVNTAAQADDTVAIQAAIDSGKTTVFLLRGGYTISDTIVLRHNMRRFNMNWALINITQAFADSGKPLFQFEDGTSPVVVVEAIDRPNNLVPSLGHFMQNNASRTLVMRDINAARFEGGVYRNTGTGKLFVEGVFGSPTADPNSMRAVAGWIFKNQEVWARHINHEGSYPHFFNDGSKLWILGFKGGEGHGPFFRTVNRGQMEVLGGVFNNLASADQYPSDPDDSSQVRAAIEIVDSEVSISAIETSRSNSPQQSQPVMVKETRNNVTRRLPSAGLPKRQSPQLNASVLTLYSTGNAINTAPTVTITAPVNNTVLTVGSPITINAAASDSDGTISEVEFFAGSTKLGEDVSAPYSFVWNSATAGNYSLTAKVTDDAGGQTTSAPVQIRVSGLIAGPPFPIPTDPALVRFVDGDSTSDGIVGDDNNNGNEATPWRTLAYAVNTAPVGATIVVRAGTYRAGSITINKQLTLQPYGRERVWIVGSVEVSDWTAEGSTWRKDNWNYEFAPTVACENIDQRYQLAGYGDQVFINGQPLRQVGNIADVGAGKFYVDYAANQIFIGTNPTNQAVEATAHKRAFSVRSANASGTVIRGLKFKRYAEEGVLVQAPDITLTHNKFSWNGLQGVSLGQDFGSNPALPINAVVYGNDFSYNGRQGIGGGRVSGMLLEANTIAHNNVENFLMKWSGAGVKFYLADNVVIRSNTVEDNRATGIWIDSSCTNATIVNNRVQRNLGHGIFFEISKGAVIASNLVVGNGTGSGQIEQSTCNNGPNGNADPSIRGGISMANSSDVKVYNNTMVGNFINLVVRDGGRVNNLPVPRGPAEIAMGIDWEAREIKIKNNILSNVTTAINELESKGMFTVEQGACNRAIDPYNACDDQERMILALDYNSYYRININQQTPLIFWRPRNGFTRTYQTLGGSPSFGATNEVDNAFEANAQEFAGTATSPLVNPFFINEATGDYRLKIGSPAIGSGQALPAFIANAIGVAAGVAVNRGALNQVILQSNSAASVSEISSVSSGMAYSRMTGTFNSTITLTNISEQSIAGPLQVVLDDLTAGVTLANKNDDFNADPYITVNVTNLAPGTSIRVPVRFNNPNNVRIGYTTKVYAGLF